MNNKKLSLVSTAKEICDITIGNYTLQAFNAWFPLSGIVSIPAGQKKKQSMLLSVNCFGAMVVITMPQENASSTKTCLKTLCL